MKLKIENKNMNIEKKRTPVVLVTDVEANEKRYLIFHADTGKILDYDMSWNNDEIKKARHDANVYVRNKI